jgi:hypothetical protein
MRARPNLPPSSVFRWGLSARWKARRALVADSRGVEFLTVKGRRGGSALASAAVNATGGRPRRSWVRTCGKAPWLTLIGIGDNGLDSLTPPARALFESAHTIIAPQRVLDRIDCGEREVIAWTFGIRQTLELLMARRGTPTTILATGDPMHFGIGATLMRDLDASEMRVIPSPSAFSLAASRLGWALQDVAQISLHGRSVHGLGFACSTRCADHRADLDRAHCDRGCRDPQCTRLWPLRDVGARTYGRAG